MGGCDPNTVPRLQRPSFASFGLDWMPIESSALVNRSWPLPKTANHICQPFSHRWRVKASSGHKVAEAGIYRKTVVDPGGRLIGVIVVIGTVRPPGMGDLGAAAVPRRNVAGTLREKRERRRQVADTTADPPASSTPVRNWRVRAAAIHPRGAPNADCVPRR